MNFEQKLNIYAELLVKHGLNVQPGQDVFIASEPIHRDFVNKVVQAAYKAGARVVSVDLQDPRNARTRILETVESSHLTHVPSFIPHRFDSMIPDSSAYLRIIGSEFPDILSELEPKKVQQVEFNIKKSMKKFYEEGVGHSKTHWTIAAASTPAWAKKIFPNLSENAATDALWDEIFKICRADKENCLELWNKHNKTLVDRARKLTEMKIKYLHFKGPGTDLRVGISPQARFKSGSSRSPRGVDFEANIPTEECFTTPDYRMTEGHVSATRPFLINGKMIRGLKLEFKKGEISHFTADKGADTFAEYINSDHGSKRLGEVALVGIDSPVYKSGHVFEEILYDENAACHIAIGFAYRFCIVGGDKMSNEELDKIGCNTSCIHTDMMISNDQVDVDAECYNGDVVSLIKKGAWVKSFE